MQTLRLGDSLRFGSVALAFLATGLASAADDPGQTPQPNPALVARGAYLATAGDCVACHSEPNFPAFSGGAAIESPYGAIYAPNITPDPRQGIGVWTDDQFYRAMHEGVGHDGENLYPAFPYQWFTKVTRDDVLAIRAYLRTIPPSDRASQMTRLTFPFDIRAGMSGWNALFFHAGEFRPDPSKSAEVNRGAYLVEGLGHCGDCHTPKGLAMEPNLKRAFAGGTVDNWYAPNLTSDREQGIGAWSDDELAAYLKTGVHRDKSIAQGPMMQVVRDSLSKLNDADLHAIALYLKQIPPIADYRPDRPSAETGPHASGASVYATNCAFCHGVDGKGRAGAVPALAGNDIVRAKAPDDVIRAVLGGHLATGGFAPMPAVGANMSDSDIANVVDYVRTQWGNAAPVIKETGLVGKIRGDTETGLAGPGARTIDGDPCLVRATSPAVPAIDDAQINDALAAVKQDNMLQTVKMVVPRARQVLSGASQADLVNGLLLAYCRTQAKSHALDKPDGRRNLDQFGQLVYAELVSNGRE